MDQDVYAATEQLLRGLDHDVLTAEAIGMSRAKDIEILGRARQERRILVTRDKDYGGLVFVEHLGSGVILLRMTATTLSMVHNEFSRVIRQYSEDELACAFVVVEAGVHRFRKLL